jgi:hypothetical protein
VILVSLNSNFFRYSLRGRQAPVKEVAHHIIPRLRKQTISWTLNSCHELTQILSKYILLHSVTAKPSSHISNIFVNISRLLFHNYYYSCYYFKTLRMRSSLNQVYYFLFVCVHFFPLQIITVTCLKPRWMGCTFFCILFQMSCKLFE